MGDLEAHIRQNAEDAEPFLVDGGSCVVGMCARCGEEKETWKRRGRYLCIPCSYKEYRDEESDRSR